MFSFPSAVPTPPTCRPHRCTMRGAVHASVVSLEFSPTLDELCLTTVPNVWCIGAPAEVDTAFSGKTKTSGCSAYPIGGRALVAPEVTNRFQLQHNEFLVIGGALPSPVRTKLKAESNSVSHLADEETFSWEEVLFLVLSRLRVELYNAHQVCFVHDGHVRTINPFWATRFDIETGCDAFPHTPPLRGPVQAQKQVLKKPFSFPSSP